MNDPGSKVIVAAEIVDDLYCLDCAAEDGRTAKRFYKHSDLAVMRKIWRCSKCKKRVA
jgi:hypothetical protein